MDKKEEYLALMINREKLYCFLARIYRVEIDQPLLDQMKVMKFPVECCETELSEGYQGLKAHLGKCGSNSLTDLDVDFAKVFLGAGISEGSAAFPYESVYTSQKRIMMQEARDKVMAIYDAKGLRADDGSLNVAEDHISLELEFMAFLCHEAQSVLETQNEPRVQSCLMEQREFLHNHLLNWVPIFCADIEKHANTEFYKAIGKITNGYLKLDSTILESLID